MANKKITALTQITTRADADVVEIVGDTATTPASYKDTRIGAFNYLAAYGQIYCHDASTAQTGIGTSYVLATGMDTDGLSNNTTLAVATDKITIPATHLGHYRVSFQVSFSGTASTTFSFAAFYAGAEITTCAASRKTNASGTIASCFGVGYINVTATGDIDLRVKADGATKSITPTRAQLIVERVKAA